MSTAVARNVERGCDVEDLACDRWPFRHVDETDLAEDESAWHDLVCTEDVVADLGGVVVEEGTPGEVKSCYDRYSPQNNGRWWIRRANHEKLLKEDGVYVLAVVDRETEAVFRMALVDATTVDALIDGTWWDAGKGGRSAEAFRQIPWTAVFHALDVDGKEKLTQEVSR